MAAQSTQTHTWAMSILFAFVHGVCALCNVHTADVDIISLTFIRCIFGVQQQMRPLPCIRNTDMRWHAVQTNRDTTHSLRVCCAVCVCVHFIISFICMHTLDAIVSVTLCANKHHFDWLFARLNCSSHSQFAIYFFLAARRFHWDTGTATGRNCVDRKRFSTWIAGTIVNISNDSHHYIAGAVSTCHQGTCWG